jgi:flagellar protein FlgJ
MNTTLPTLAIPAAPVDTTAATTYTDLNGLASLRRDPTSPQAIEGVAAQVEALFLQMMLKSMRDATASDDPDSNEMGMYQDMFDKQVALSISQHDDLGIGAILKRQLSGKTAPAAPKQASAGISDAAWAAPTSAGAAAAMVQTPAQFINQVMPSIRRAAATLGVNPKGLLAQAALETGWGRRMPRNADGSSSLNLFGVKAGDEWEGARATADTVEYSNGVATPRRSVFRSYGSIEESVSDFANLLKNSPRYRQAIGSGADPRDYIDGIGNSGYATDPDYAHKLTQILNSAVLQAALIPRTAAL